MLYKKKTAAFSHIILICGILLTGYLSPAMGMEKSPHPEIERYRGTLTPEKVRAYEEALANYQSGEYIEQETPIIKNRLLRQRYREVTDRPETNAGELWTKINAFLKLSEDAARKGEKQLEMDCLYQAFMTACWSEPRHYMKAFEIAILLEEKLAHVTEKEYPERRTAYFRISEGYYLFKDYNKSIELAKQAITDAPARSFTDQANLNGRKMLAICYGIIGEFDLSDQYIYSTFESPDMVLDRPIYNAIALSHMACNYMDKKEYRKALALDQEVLPLLRESNDRGHVAGMYACQCFSYFGLNEPYKVGQIVDSILFFANQDWYNKNKRLKQAYMNLSRYNGVIENIPKMQEYQDSLIAIYQREEAETASQYILQAGSVVAQQKLQDREETLQIQRHLLRVIGLILLMTFSFMIVIHRLYRQQRAAYKTLIEKSEQWTRSGNFSSGDRTKHSTQEPPDEEDILIAEKLKNFMLAHKPYTDPNLTIEILSGRMDIGRHKLSRAINRTMDKNFNQYINEFRVREAILFMSDPQFEKYSMDELMEQAGFNGRTSFYQAFKKETGLTPAQYRKNKKTP